MDLICAKFPRRSVAETSRKHQAREDERFAFIHLPQELQEIAHWLAEGWSDLEITGFLSLELGQIQKAREQLALLYRPS